MWSTLLEDIIKGDNKSLARCISLVENEAEGFETFMESLPYNNNCSIIGITGPPGAGKSTLTDALIGSFVENGKKVAVLCIDPSSPFNYGALLGDRIRMSGWHDNPNVFIRSMASRGSLGGLHPRIIEVTEVIKQGGFDHIIIETVGVGQSEVEIAGLADITVVVLVPESGDEIQTMKAGIMEIADIFVVNKSDRPGADLFLKHLRQLLAPTFHNKNHEIPIIPTIASEKKGINELINATGALLGSVQNNLRNRLLAEKIYNIIREKRMKDVSKEKLMAEISNQSNKNLYSLAKGYFTN